MLLKLIAEEARGTWSRIVPAAALSGIANAGMLAIVNVAARTASHPSARLCIMFVAACALYALCLRQCVSTISALFETALYKVRLRVADKIQSAELLGLERIGTSEIYERLTQETTVISQAAWPIAVAAQTVVMLVFTALYLLVLSTEAFLLALLLYGAGILILRIREARAQELMRESTATQVGLFERLNDLLKGFKEVRFRTKRSDEIFSDYKQLAASVRSSTVRTNVVNKENFIFINLNLFVLQAGVVFVLPLFFHEQSQVLNNVAAVIVFLLGAIDSLLWSLPQYGRAKMAAENIQDLEQKLEHAASCRPSERVDPWDAPFREIRLAAAQFHYVAAAGQEPFAIGPIDLRIKAGEMVFIVGGNGSGKSTLVKVLTALYAPTAGTLWVDDKEVTPNNVQAYREHIAAIFGDFHLFKKLYGLPDISGDDVQRLLEKMQIAHKTSFQKGSMSTLDLSTGQRKRLAMVVALLEDRPIYVFDEWAADQDPEFRSYYYRELLPELKRRGKTVIAISHDDRYFDCADRVIMMEYGQVRSIYEPTGPVAPEPERPALAQSRD